MLSDNLSFQRQDTIGIITLSRPEARNAINWPLAQELAELCDSLDNDDEIKVIIITGAGDETFCAGTDPEVLAKVYERTGEAKLPHTATLVASLKIPVISAINGDALGQGLELALACDFRIAVESAQFSLPQVDTGFIPWDGATQRLPRLIGSAKALEMLLTGQKIDASEAYKIGLVNKVVPRGELMSEVLASAKMVAARAYWPSRYAKEAILKGMDLTLEQGLRLESDLYFLLQTTEDRTEGIKAFQQKRAPHFKDK